MLAEYITDGQAQDLGELGPSSLRLCGSKTSFQRSFLVPA